MDFMWSQTKESIVLICIGHVSLFDEPMSVCYSNMMLNGSLVYRFCSALVLKD